jgi:hypothetical protein
MPKTILASDPAKQTPGKAGSVAATGATIGSASAQADGGSSKTTAQTNTGQSSGPYATRTYDSQYNNNYQYNNNQQTYSQQSPSRTYRYPARNPYAVDPYARNPYARAYGYDYCNYYNQYGERDPYCRNPYARYWYGGVPPEFYLRRR